MKCEERLLLYIDVLGTKKIIENNPEEINDNLFGLLEFLYLKSNRPISSNDLEITTFSDHLAMSIPLTKNPNIDNHSLNRFIESAGYVQVEGLKNGLLLRGVIEKGMLYHKENFIVGEALVSAYKKESKRTKYPRVILSERITDKAIEGVTTDIDNERFVNYLEMRSCIGSSNIPGLFNQFYQKISEELKSNILENGDIFQKWLWQAQKFNSALTFWKNDELTDNESRNSLELTTSNFREKFIEFAFLHLLQDIEQKQEIRSESALKLELTLSDQRTINHCNS